MPRTAEPAAVNLGPLEAEVMGLVWREGLKTVAEVTERANQSRPRPLDYNTLLTVMSNLTKKKMLRRRRKGNAYHFSPTCTEEEFAYRQGAATALGLLGRYGDVAVAGFVDQLALAPELLARLEALRADREERSGGEGAKDE